MSTSTNVEPCFVKDCALLVGSRTGAVALETGE